MGLLTQACGGQPTAHPDHRPQAVGQVHRLSLCTSEHAYTYRSMHGNVTVSTDLSLTKESIFSHVWVQHSQKGLGCHSSQSYSSVRGKCHLHTGFPFLFFTCYVFTLPFLRAGMFRYTETY